ncbi:MAG: dihydrolipoyllysine-residue succinyltransferase [Phyllobacteriaceae bacterium]|nr:dihydrolipoyllysine-residue succinyltransferase [Phyllobacteriaceae bacterium]MBA90845.1 dihydrolipoyllysine-residue succinyltransferase [Phyllobacteriaceae bacterium]
MATEIRVPTLGESVTEATIGQWFKKVGDAVAADEPLVELETDKVTVEVPAPAAGKLTEITAKEGETVELNALLGMIAEGEGAAAAPAEKKAEPKAEDMPEPAPSGSETVSKGMEDARSGEMPAAPSAAKLMAEKGLDASQVSGSGKRGQVLKGDVLDAINKGTGSAPAAAPAAARAPSSGDDEAREERVKMTRLRQTIARRLKDAQNTAAMLTTFNEVDMTATMELRKKYKDIFEKKHGVKLGFMGFFAKAVTHALKEIPAVNAEIDGTDIIYKNYCHIGVAVGTDKGLVVPVVRDADQMSIAAIEKEIGRLGKAGRDGTLTMADMQGGTFTISNGGVYGSLMSTPILNAPQSGILGMHKIQDRPMVVNGQIVIRPMMYLALSYDHRIVDGKEAVTFLVRVKESLEDPERLVLDL